MSPFINGPTPPPEGSSEPNFEHETGSIKYLSDLSKIENYDSLKYAQVDWDLLEKEVTFFDPNSSQLDSVKDALRDILGSAKNLIQQNKAKKSDLVLIEKANKLLLQINESTHDTSDLGQTMSVSELVYAAKIHSSHGNQTTLFGSDIQEIPSHQLFISESGHAFDIEELETIMNAKGKLSNPYTKTDFTSEDLEELGSFDLIKQNPAFKVKVSEDEAYLKRKHLGCLAKEVPMQTKEKVTELSHLFYRQFGSGSHVTISSESDLELRAKTLIEFKDYFDQLDLSQQQALNELASQHNYKKPLDQVIDDLLKGSCNSTYAKYFENLVNLLNTY